MRVPSFSFDRFLSTHADCFFGFCIFRYETQTRKFKKQPHVKKDREKSLANYSSLPHQLQIKFGSNPWYNSLFGYLLLRYKQIEGRVKETSRYVEIQSDNKGTYSYEFGSIIRDIGSVFSSLLDCIVDKTTKKPKKSIQLTIIPNS